MIQINHNVRENTNRNYYKEKSIMLSNSCPYLRDHKNFYKVKIRYVKTRYVN